MGINLRDYINDVNELLTEEEAERILEAAGYVKFPEKDVNSNLYFDCCGEKLVDGSKFIYQFNTPYAVEGYIRAEDDVLYIFWSDDHPTQTLKDFWFAGADENLTKIIGNIYD